MLMKYHWASSKMLILGVCLFLPSLANARGITAEGFAVFLLGFDAIVLPFAILNVVLSKGLGIRLLTFFSGINVAVLVVGVLAKIFIYFGTTTLSVNDLLEFSTLIAAYSTGYLWIAVPIDLVVLLFLSLLRYLFEKPVISKSGINEQRLDQTHPDPAIHNSFGGKP